jgi:hypothetical protein
MAEKSCDTCDKEGVGGISYGNCQQFLARRREINRLDVCLESFFSLSGSSVKPE